MPNNSFKKSKIHPTNARCTTSGKYILAENNQAPFSKYFNDHRAKVKRTETEEMFYSVIFLRHSPKPTEIIIDSATLRPGLCAVHEKT